ncbi:MAG: MarR family winged helix-turn-helix transcriptional regulator [Acidimicrobiales bacterium]
MHDRLANLLGAAGLAVVDLARTAIDEAGGKNPSWSAALITLAREPGIGATDLARHITLTQPGASRLVDGLVSAGLIERVARSGRSVALRLTAEGQSEVRRLLDARRDALDSLVASLTAVERSALERILETILDRAYDHARSGSVLCRLCDHTACVGRGETCPVTHAAQERGVHA